MSAAFHHTSHDLTDQSEGIALFSMYYNRATGAGNQLVKLHYNTAGM